jgi:F-type H+-transporting ATPase subunit delta
MTESLKDKNSELISKRWAKALMELVCEDSEISKEKVLEDLNFISDTIKSSAELSEVITNPSVSTEEKQVIICKLFQDKVLSVVYNFIFALNLRKRLYLAGYIAEEFAKELDKLNNVKHVNVTSAIELNDTKKDEIKDKIASKLNANIDVNWETNNEIIAGLVFDIDETVIDNSIRHKLEDLSNSIIKG